MSSSALAALYNAAPIILWVEDLTTRAYLKAVWGNDRRIAVYVGGGAETLRSVVEDAQRSGRSQVFGLRDRDFSKSNRARWGQPDVHFFTLETFEVECFILDPVALASCPFNTAGRTEAELRARLMDDATDHLWWMSARRVFHELGVISSKGFPRHPKRTQVKTQVEAEALLLESDWIQQTVPTLPTTLGAAEIRQLLTDAHGHYQSVAQRGLDPLIAGISGKEILRGLLSWVWTKHRPKGPQAEHELAKAVAEEQRRAGRTPAELEELHRELVSRLRP
ncbi:MAG: hypothetical protein H6741_15060 [Alphaproteobacteria bacterium]|nr:hypothetical protein [Alphaproteobacteria bacterium]MCB9794032.1 hypothetical protein [Alphaproteobacteria bacterium]